MTVTAQIIKKLNETFAPTHLAVTDESHLHEGHAGAKPEGETHFRILVVSEKFTDQPLIARQRMVHACLQGELAGHIHALSMQTKTPAEYEAAQAAEQGAD